MRHLFLGAALLLLAARAAGADPFSEGLQAYDRGDYAGALALWHPLAVGGDAHAQRRVGRMFANGKGVPANSVTAVMWLQSAAEQGDARAQHALGAMYDLGEGVPEDDVGAAMWYRLAAMQGDAEAQTRLAQMYRRGEGVPRDLAQADEWAQLALVQESAPTLGGSERPEPVLTPDDEATLAQARLAAQKGDPFAQALLDELAAAGSAEAPQAESSALANLRGSAEVGDADAQFALGTSYSRGEGVSQDVVEAVKWYRLAAEQGHADAQGALGALYASGQGVPRNDMRAYAWSKLAAQQGSRSGAAIRDAVRARLTPAEIALAEATARALGVGSAAQVPVPTLPRPKGSPRDKTGDPLVRDIQIALTARGYAVGVADGLIGARTRAAIRAFQRRAGLPPSGDVSAKLLTLLRAR